MRLLSRIARLRVQGYELMAGWTASSVSSNTAGSQHNSLIWYEIRCPHNERKMRRKWASCACAMSWMELRLNELHGKWKCVGKIDFSCDIARQLGNRPSIICIENPLMISCWSCGSCLCILSFFHFFSPVSLSQLPTEISWLFLWWQTMTGRF